MSQQALNTEIRRVTKPNEYSLNLCIPRQLARILDFNQGDLLKFSIKDKKQLIVEKAVFSEELLKVQYSYEMWKQNSTK